jgi:hypothetical protein
MKKPVYDHRTIVGYAATKKQAQKIVKDALPPIPKGWKITVQERNTDIIELPPGWIYSVHP